MSAAHEHSHAPTSYSSAFAIGIALNTLFVAVEAFYGWRVNSLALLADARDEERAILSAIPYQSNRAWLHTDERLMPRRRAAWAAWNYLSNGDTNAPEVSVTYWLNRLQPLPFRQQVLLSLNPLFEPRAERAIAQSMRLELVGQPVRVCEVAPGMVHTEEFSLTRFGGDRERAEKVYSGIPDPLTAGDVAEVIRWVVAQPPHVNVDRVVVRPLAQAAQHKVHRVLT